MYSSVKAMGTNLENKYKGSTTKIHWMSIKSGQVNKVPSELATLDIVYQKMGRLSSGSVVLHCRPNMLLSFDYLNRVRMNTMRGFQVFFPIPFLEFRLGTTVYDKQALEVRKESGYFDVHHFDHFSFYWSDYSMARHGIEAMVPVAGSDRDLTKEIYYDSHFDVYQMFLDYNLLPTGSGDHGLGTTSGPRLHIMRSVEPELKLKFWKSNCDANEGNKFSQTNCWNRYSAALGSKSRLASIITEHEQEPEAEEEEAKPGVVDQGSD
jgi:chondroitin polymerizing factor/chondroitin polymerizing factor 2